MPHRLAASFLPPLFSSSLSNPIASFLLPALAPSHHRHASILASLSSNPGELHRKIRRGRGPSSGKGKTSGRGHKGQKQHGKVPEGFNGGQTPLEVVHGVRGFKNNFAVDMTPLNLDKLQSWIDQGRIDPSRPITIKELGHSRCVTNVKDGVKLLARGKTELHQPINIVTSRASAAAIATIEAAGGSVMTRYYTRESIRRILRGTTHPVLSLGSSSGPDEEVKKRFFHRLPDATSRKDIEYYRDAAHRGYLSHQVSEGQGPSLFFKAPGARKTTTTKRITSGKTNRDENRIW